MQRLGIICAACAFGLAAIAAPAFAHGDPGDRRADRVEWLKKRLDLSSDQAERLRTSEAADREAERSLRDKAAADLAQLRVLVDQKAGDDPVKAQLDALAQDKKAMEAQAWKRIDAVRAILTPVQQAKFLLLMHGHGAKGGWEGGWDREGGDGAHCAPRER